jgi:hypothetical protein
MIYVETIMDEETEITIERQKNAIEGKWYGICLQTHITPDRQVIIADNNTFIMSLGEKTKTEILKLFQGSDLSEEQQTKEIAKSIRKVVRCAKELEWF